MRTVKEHADGGYDEGYRSCDCFWGTAPSSLVRELDGLVPSVQGLRVLDVGCGEGKNAVNLSDRGADVTAIDVSELAIRSARRLYPELKVTFVVDDLRTSSLLDRKYDIVVAYGVLHCLRSPAEVNSMIDRLKAATMTRGLNVVCAFNSRSQDIARAHPGFSPTLMPRRMADRTIQDLETYCGHDSDLTEVHPHNNVVHSHSLTRLIAQRE